LINLMDSKEQNKYKCPLNSSGPDHACNGEMIGLPF
jgi:hypothetical protein